MKILHIIRSVDLKGGGPIEGIKQLSKSMMAKGHEVEILSLDAPGSECIRQSTNTVHAMGPGIGKYGYSPHIKPWLAKHCGEYDAFVVNGIWQYHSMAARSVLVSKGRTYYVYTHGMLDPWFKRAYPLKHLKKWLYWPWADYRVLRDAKAVLFTCEEEMRLAPESFWLYKVNPRVVKYGSARPPSDAERVREVFLESYPELRGKRVLLFLSRIHEKKGCDLLIEAFAKVASKVGDAMLVMAGPDQTGLAAKLQKIAVDHGIADRIVWTGMLQGDLKWGAFYASELFVLPSHQENFGIAVAEALGCGLPVLISNKVNIWREIEADGAGLVGNDDATDTEQNLRRWLAMPAEDRAAMSERARSCFEDRFTVEQMAGSLIDTIKELSK